MFGQANICDWLTWVFTARLRRIASLKKGLQFSLAFVLVPRPISNPYSCFSGPMPSGIMNLAKV